MAVAAMAIPAKRTMQTVTLADGSSVNICQHGDEYAHWFEAEDGREIRLTADGQWEALAPVSREQMQLRREASPRYQGMQKAAQKTEMERPLNIAPRGLIILVNFKDVSFTKDVEDIKAMMSSDNYYKELSYASGGKTRKTIARGSARQYFIDQSMGQYQPQFDVVGPYTLANNRKYYGENDYYDQDKHPEEMIIEACLMADAEGVDFSQYDHNDDGDVDFVYVIYAGYGENDGGTSECVWPHSQKLRDWYYYYNSPVKIDDKVINTYACSNEIDYETKLRCGIGTFCHEFSHVLGLPDLYITDGSSQWKTMGDWDVLDYGPYLNHSNTPPCYSAYERFFMGWLTPTLLTSKPASIGLGKLQYGNIALIVTETDECNFKGNDPDPTKFWMLENRQKSGWDEYLPGEGMIITRVKYSYAKWDDNKVNNTKTNMGVDLLEADGSAPNNSSGKAKDAFPAGATEYELIVDAENPSLVTFYLSNIRLESGNIYFDVNGGGEENMYLDIENTPTYPAANILKTIRQGQVVLSVDGKTYDIIGRNL